MSEPAPAWRVRRVSGLLVPGFSKRFERKLQAGVTSWLGVPVGGFEVHRTRAGRCELRYVRWPVVDELERTPSRGGRIAGVGYVRLPGGRRVRFCRFSLER